MKKITLLLALMFSCAVIGQPDVQAPEPTDDPVDVVSVFGDTFTGNPTLVVANFSPAGNSASVVSAGGSDVLELIISGGVFTGFNINGDTDGNPTGDALNLASMEQLHFDLWVDGSVGVGAVFNTTVSQHNGGHLTGQSTGYVGTQPIAEATEGQWLSFDLPFDTFGPDLAAGARDIISQLVFTHLNMTGPLYLDNVYFWRAPVMTDTDATLSDLTLDGTTVAGFAPTIFTYDVELVNGTTTGPTVAATASQAGMGSSNVSIANNNTMVPGTTTVTVTAPDGTTTQDYLINFTEAAPLPPNPPVPTEPAGAVIPIRTNNTGYADIGINFFEPFGSVFTEYDLDTDGNPDTFSFINGNGGQFNYFGSADFNIDISNAGAMHVDFYAENLDPGDDLRIVIVQDGGPIMEIILPIDNTSPSQWQSFDISLPGGSGGTLNFTGADKSNFTDLGGIQFFPQERASTLGSELVFISNVYFFGGSLSTPEFDLGASFAVAPNPSKDVWNIKAAANQNVTSVVVYDMLGKEVLSLEPNTNEVVLNAADLRSGIYLAKLATANGSKTIKLIKN